MLSDETHHFRKKQVANGRSVLASYKLNYGFSGICSHSHSSSKFRGIEIVYGIDPSLIRTEGSGKIAPYNSIKSSLHNRILNKDHMLSALMNNLDGMVYCCLKDSQWTMVYLGQGCRNDG
jgi:hypothetical protein